MSPGSIFGWALVLALAVGASTLGQDTPTPQPNDARQTVGAANQAADKPAAMPYQLAAPPFSGAP